MAESTTERRASPMAVLAIVGFGVFVAADDLTVVSTMLRPIIGDLDIVLPDGLDDAAWIVNAYLIAYVAVMPFVGRLSDIVGRRKVFMGAMTLFLIGSIIIPFQTSLGPFLFGRVLTAIGGGALVPVGMAVVGDAFAERRRARALGILGAIDTLGWVWGPLYGAMLVRFASWEWQFYLNWPLAVFGMIAGWRMLADFDRPMRRARIDWAGAAALTITLVALNLALLGSAEIQSVSGLDELTGGTGAGLRWFYLVAAASLAWFIWLQRRTADPIIDFRLFAGRNLTAAVVVNFLVGGALVIAMVDVPLFVNVIELDIERSAVISGWLLASLTATMSVASYAGGRFTERTWYRPPVVAGLAAAGLGFILMGAGWGADTTAVGVIEPVPSYPTMAWQLALLGIGFGLVIAPTSAAVVDGAPADRRGTAASLVIVVRLMGLSVGLSGLTAWGLYRFNQLRDDIVLPPLGDPGFQEAITDANAELTTGSLAGTFAAAAVVLLVALAVTLWMRRPPGGPTDHAGRDRSGSDPIRNDAPTTTDPSPPAPKEPSVKDFLNRNIIAIVTGLAIIVTGLVAVVILLLGRLGAVDDEMAATRADLERVEAGAALFAGQVQNFQEQISDLAPAVDAGLGQAIDGLASFRTSTIEFDVEIDESVAIDTVIDLNRTIEVPISTTVPIDETIQTRITVDGPFGIDIPLNITVPIAVDVPIDLTVSIPVNESIPIATEVPVQVAVPIAIDVAETELAELAASLEAGLAGFQDVLANLAQ
jgi:MFS family permease